MFDANRILIVDDEPNVRLAFRAALETDRHAVREAGDGQEALEELERGAASLVLLDLRMPRLGGMETLRRLRDAGNTVPVVIITAHGTIPDSVEAMKLGAIDFLPKPITPEELRRVVREVIGRHARPEREPGPEPHAPRPGHRIIVTFGPAAVDLTAAKRALNERDFDRAEVFLEIALATSPHCAEALTLMGVLRESRRQDHAAYQAYRAALESDPHYGPARDNMRRYCERFGLDFGDNMNRHSLHRTEGCWHRSLHDRDRQARGVGSVAGRTTTHPVGDQVMSTREDIVPLRERSLKARLIASAVLVASLFILFGILAALDLR